MKITYLAVAAALALSTPVLAAPVTPNQTAAADSDAANIVYRSWVDAWRSTMNAAYGVDKWANDLFSSFGSGGKKYLTGEIWTPDNTFYQVFTWNTGTKIASYNTPTAVPGPEAGAGLGALAMGGIALYLKRRRKETSIA